MQHAVCIFSLCENRRNDVSCVEMTLFDVSDELLNGMSTPSSVICE
jgi:hypothetical protein